ncbi:MAG TPA: ABC transporter ATP-binding protein [Spirochaetales bacterium]|nr:ABC transporter ATP-binding protein [Spirochaetales bacterium]
MAILSLQKIRKVYDKGGSPVVALGGVDLEIEKGEYLAVVGPSGSGKTTLLNILGCLDAPTEGRIVYAGRELRGLGERDLSEYRKEHVSFIFQSYNLIPVLTVLENVELPLVIERRLRPAEVRAKARELIAAVGLSDKEGRFPRELSGGQEQRVAIARALVKDPIVVLADEPTANLDSHTAEEIVELMRRINAERSTTFIFSTHDRLVMEHARRIVTLRDGAVTGDERR